jgi:hypothetical protein
MQSGLIHSQRITLLVIENEVKRPWTISSEPLPLLV